MSKQSTAGKVAAGLGVAALAAGAAAAYFLTGEGAKKNRKTASAWVKKAKSDLLQKIKQMERVSKTTYHQAAKEVIAKYQQAKNVNPAELAAFGTELQQHWQQISERAKTLTKKPAANRARVKSVKTKHKNSK